MGKSRQPGSMLRPAIAVVALLAAAASGPSHASWKDRSAKAAPNFFYFSKIKPKASEPHGCVAGTLGYRQAVRSAVVVSMLFRRNQAGAVQEAWVEFTDTPKVSMSAQGDGATTSEPFVLCLKPGQYVLEGFRIDTGVMQYTAPQTWSVLVDVVAGRTTYLGNYTLYLAHDRDDCTNRDLDIHLVARDHAAQDLDAIRALPAAAGQDVLVALPDLSGLEPQLYSCLALGRGDATQAPGVP
jgi:hypothetical protein